MLYVVSKNLRIFQSAQKIVKISSGMNISRLLIININLFLLFHVVVARSWDVAQ
jgi:hypothetical protein